MKKKGISRIFPRLTHLRACRRRNFPQITCVPCDTTSQFTMVDACVSVGLQVFNHAQHVLQHVQHEWKARSTCRVTRTTCMKARSTCRVTCATCVKARSTSLTTRPTRMKACSARISRQTTRIAWFLTSGALYKVLWCMAYYRIL